MNFIVSKKFIKALFFWLWIKWKMGTTFKNSLNTTVTNKLNMQIKIEMRIFALVGC